MTGPPPEEPEEPDQPDQPEQPEQPDQPEQPEQPERPEQPEAPDELAGLMPFLGTVGGHVLTATPEEVVAGLDWAPERCTAGGVLHGGALMTLADSAGAACAYLNLPPGAATATVTSTTTFLAAVRAGTVRAVARPLHVGRAVITVEVSLLDAADRRVAHTVATQAVLPAS